MIDQPGACPYQHLPGAYEGEVFVEEPKSVEEIEDWEAELDQALDAEPEEAEEPAEGEEDKEA